MVHEVQVVSEHEGGVEKNRKLEGESKGEAEIEVGYEADV